MNQKILLMAAGLADSSIRNQAIDLNGVHSNPRGCYMQNSTRLDIGVPVVSCICRLNDIVSAVNCKLLVYKYDSALMVHNFDAKVIQEQFSSELDFLHV